MGVDRNRIRRGALAGRLHRVHHGVYAVGHTALSREGRWLAAVLACGDGALLSHRSAATLWGLIEREAPRPDVTVRSRRRVGGVITHTSPFVEGAGVRRVTTPAWTLADLAHTLSDRDLTRAVREAQFRRLFHLPSMLAVLDHRPSRALKALVEDLNPTQSHLEDRPLTICKRHGLPAPLTQQQIGATRVDFVWPDERLVVETDGYRAHATPHAFQHDRTTTNDLQLDGYTILRFTHADLAHRAVHVADGIARALRAGHEAAERVA